MQPHELQQICKYYDYCPQFYQKNFDAVFKFMQGHPNATRIDVIKFAEANDIPNQSCLWRMTLDARRLVNIDFNKVPKEYAETEMHTLEDGDVSRMTWRELTHKKTLVLSDIHFPYHDKEALMIALRKGKEEGVDAILLNGDIIDFYQLSKFVKDYRKPSVREELDIFRFFIDQLKQRFPEAEIYYKLGNHEVRLERWIQTNAQMFDGLLDIDSLVQFRDHDVNYLKDNIGVKIGKLHIIHGHEVRASMGVVNIARTYYLKTGVNLLFGHWHQQQEYITRSMDGTNSGAWAQGCLCKLDAEYTYGINQWVHGFSIVELMDAGQFRVKLYKIINGEIV
jgi:predicted phosphodiesterase